ncbi:fungal hydrophobin [Trametopsis cervina]|nr:fungal hydrophobin [Trametopsis cervina]
MFSRISVYAVLALSVLATATPAPAEKRGGQPTTAKTTITVTAPASTPTSAGSCNTGPIQCCQSTESASSAAGNALLGLLGIVVSDLNVLLGVNCSPISVVGIGSGGTCDASPVCCENNAIGGLISIGCVPIQL